MEFWNDRCAFLCQVLLLLLGTVQRSVEVRNAGFTENPNFNSKSGMFEAGEFSGTSTFTWQNAGNAGVTLTNEGSGSNLDDNILYTGVVLDNLGAVKTTNLTITGSTTIDGDVYGGGALASMETDKLLLVSRLPEELYMYTVIVPEPLFLPVTVSGMVLPLHDPQLRE